MPTYIKESLSDQFPQFLMDNDFFINYTKSGKTTIYYKQNNGTVNVCNSIWYCLTK